MKISILGFIMLFTINSQAQNFKFGEVSITELAESFYPKDSSINATVLYKSEKISFDFRHDEGIFQIREVHERIKIYNKEGYNWATKRMRLYNQSNLKSERLEHLIGYTYNLVDGKIEDTKLKKDGIFNEEADKYWKVSSFTMPNINDGSVIEYSYQIVSTFFTINDINYQYTIPINVLDVSVRIPEYYIYNKLLNPKASYKPRIIESNRHRIESITRSRVYGFYVAKGAYSQSKLVFSENVITSNETNIPALIDEPFVDNIDNYKAKLILELTDIKYPNEPIESLSSSWEAVTKTIYDNPEFGNQLNRSSYFKEDIDALISDVDNPAQKSSLIFNFVKSKVKWNGYYGYRSNVGVRKAYKEGAGNIADINLMLISMLRYAGIKANPVLVSTKNNGIPLYPTRQGFNYVICIIENEGLNKLLDATENYSTVGVLPKRVLNWKGRVIRENGSSDWVELVPQNSSMSITNLNCEMNLDLSLIGKVRTQKFGYLAKQYRDKYSNSNQESYIKTLEKDNTDLIISNFETQGEDELEESIKMIYEYNMDNAVEEIGDKLYFSPLFFLKTQENPFKADERKLPIDLMYPVSNKYLINIMLPDGYNVELLPENLRLDFLDKIGEFKYLINQSGRLLQINLELNMNTSFILPENYTFFKEFFTQAIEKESEKIVLKKI